MTGRVVSGVPTRDIWFSSRYRPGAIVFRDDWIGEVVAVLSPFDFSFHFSFFLILFFFFPSGFGECGSEVEIGMSNHDYECRPFPSHPS